MIKFNISASSYSVFKESPLVFYFQYILKLNPDTISNQSYGLAGNAVHNTLDEYAKDKSLDVEKVFNEKWDNNNLDEISSFNGKPLDRAEYCNALNYGKRLIDKVYPDGFSEEGFVLPFYKENDCIIDLKGFIDYIYQDSDGDIYIIDWKTNNSKTDFTLAAKMYFLLYLKKYNTMPKAAIYEYIKIGAKTKYEFSLEEIQEFESELKSFCRFISKARTNINKYEVGNIDSPFNNHASRCLQEKLKRDNAKAIECDIKDNMIHFKSLPDKLKTTIVLKYSYFKNGVVFSGKFKSGSWDGRKYFFNIKKNTLPLAFINDLKDLITDYNANYKTNYALKINDYREDMVRYDTKFTNSGIKLRYYQKEAVEEALDKKIGILALGCSAGKTIIAAELIKRLNTKTLFLVHRIELATQTKEEVENYLGVETGLMTEGELSVDKQITISSVQTIHAILKRKDDTTELLKEYLKNVHLVIGDEVQNVKNSGFYKSVYSNTLNVHYSIGLSGSPWRTDNDTLEMNSLVGLPIYYKLNKDLTEEGWLCPTKCLFIDTKEVNTTDVYPDAYDKFIVNNVYRNAIIATIANAFGSEKKILILTRRIKHAEMLSEVIPNSEVITGITDKTKRKNSYENFKNTKGLILIGSSKIFSAGINIPDLDIIINATAHKSSIDSIQIVGRAKRKNEGKKYGYYIDFNDKGKFFYDATRDRVNILKTFGEDVTLIKDLNELEFE